MNQQVELEVARLGELLVAEVAADAGGHVRLVVVPLDVRSVLGRVAAAAEGAREAAAAGLSLRAGRRLVLGALVSPHVAPRPRHVAALGTRQQRRLDIRRRARRR